MFCADCKHLPAHSTSRFCRMGVEIAKKKALCRYKIITKRIDEKGIAMNQRQAYIGSKIILAEEMDEFTFKCRKEGSTPKVDIQVEPRVGYLVIYPNPDGSKYESWSPKDVFELAYRCITKWEADAAQANFMVIPS